MITWSATGSKAAQMWLEFCFIIFEVRDENILTKFVKDIQLLIKGTSAISNGLTNSYYGISTILFLCIDIILNDSLPVLIREIQLPTSRPLDQNDWQQAHWSVHDMAAREAADPLVVGAGGGEQALRELLHGLHGSTSHNYGPKNHFFKKI